MNAHQISTEDLCKVIPNKFEMILVASIRSRELAKRDDRKTKPTTAALIEILEGKIDRSYLDKIKKKK
jgi:DNA-directed RNA polymerase omega subunit